MQVFSSIIYLDMAAEQVIYMSIIAGILAIIFGLLYSFWIFKLDTGSEKMMAIASAIQDGANAFLRRQYMTIGAVGLILAVVIYFVLGAKICAGFLIGAVLSGLTGFIGMMVSVNSNVRTAQAASVGIHRALDVAFRGGAGTGLLVVG